MNDRQLRYFVAIAEQLSFSKAAKLLNISQPPLSMHIKALEAELGVMLFTRSRRNVELTQAGELLLEHARKTIKQFDYTADIVRKAALGEAGVLRIGFTSSVPLLDVFARVMRTFRKAYPNVRLELQHLSTGQQFAALAGDQLDAGILRPPYNFTSREGLDVHEIWRDRLMVFLPEGHRLANSQEPLRIQDLSSEDFVTVSKGLGCGVNDHTMTLCGAAGFTPSVVQEGNELSTVLGLVAAGIGISIMPECYAGIGISGVANRLLASKDAESRFLLAIPSKAASNIPRRFLEVVLGVIGQDCAKAA
jgi:DNA-binding transcriptional LysR family regulator